MYESIQMHTAGKKMISVYILVWSYYTKISSLAVMDALKRLVCCEWQSGE